MSRITKMVPFVAVLALILAAPVARAYWIPDGAPVCTAAGSQSGTVIVSDGAGGAVIAWQDTRGGNYDIYAQRVNASGAVLWTADGVALCTAVGTQQGLQIISDGAGGAIVAWSDYRSGGSYDIYAQRVSASGTVLWTVDGVAICVAAGAQQSPQLCADGVGGAIVAWSDLRSGSSYDIFAQRVNAAGAVLWTTNGSTVCGATGEQTSPLIVSDGAGGGIIVWSDFRGGANSDLYAQRMLVSGGASWTANGIAICTAAYDQSFAAIAPDGGSGALVAWQDYRNGSHNDIYALKLTITGFMPWTANGVAVCTTMGEQSFPALTTDGAGGAFVTWQDYRSASTWDIYAQRVNSAGAAQWAANGAPVCGVAGHQDIPSIHADGAGGAIIAWEDLRLGGNDLFVQRVSAAGVTQWTAGGAAICTVPGTQTYPRLASDGAGGVIVGWYDSRSGNTDIYAQQVGSGGLMGCLGPDIHSVRDVPGDQGGRVNLAWDASRADLFDGAITRYTLWRALGTPAALAKLAAGAIRVAGPEQIGPGAGKGTLRPARDAASGFYWELIDAQDAYRLDRYGRIVATAFDSTSVSPDPAYFQVIAHTVDAWRFYASASDSGRSLDNLAPLMPAGMKGAYSLDATALHWHPNHDSDLAGYRLHRGDWERFIPGPGNLVAAGSDTSFMDRTPGFHYYKLCAIDVHENPSPYALLTPRQTTAVPGAPSAALRLHPNRPNPFNPRTTLRFDLPSAGPARLAVYDLAGRLVRILVDRELPAGSREAAWDGTDASGRAMASGSYLARLEAGGMVEVVRMGLVR